MAWKIEFSPRAFKAFNKIDKSSAIRILAKLEEISNLKDPKETGSPLTGILSGLWRYRIGDYRVICSIEYETIVIFVVDIGHRRDIYR
ncbi:MAG: type II toxin-antitoxin system RelE/ParE family toxin [Clostridiaceae bacterium]|nr:type II toxin-antitoxin system RelE/ParE family toxin [Clostridiaceae bacterium]